MRVSIPILLALLTACGDPQASPKAPVATVKSGTAKKEVVAATTGISVIQRDHDDLRNDVGALEKKKAEEITAIEITRLRKRAGYLFIAIDRAMKEEAKSMARARAGRLRRQWTTRRTQEAELRDEIRTIKEMVTNARKGAAELPEGYTETELLDTVGDNELKVKRLVEEREELRKELAAAEALMQQPEIPPQGETMFNRERAELEKTKARIEALAK